MTKFTHGGPRPGSGRPPKPENEKAKYLRLPVKEPETDREREAIELWQRATPAQRLALLVELHQFGQILHGKIKPWESEHFY